MNNTGNSLGNFILEKRKSQEISLAELAIKTGMSPSYLNRLERGERKNPTIDVIAAIAQVFNVEINTIMKVAGYEAICTQMLKEDLQMINFFRSFNTNEKNKIGIIVKTLTEKGITDSNFDLLMNLLTSL